MHRKLNQIALQPVQRIIVNNNNNNDPNNNPNNNQNDDGNNGGTNYVSTLSSTPRTLHVLWQEYKFGLGGQKAARLFTAVERGKVKYTYHRRKVVWDIILMRIRAGNTAQIAEDRIYEVYGVNWTVSAIINQMRKD